MFPFSPTAKSDSYMYSHVLILTIHRAEAGKMLFSVPDKRKGCQKDIQSFPKFNQNSNYEVNIWFSF